MDAAKTITTLKKFVDDCVLSAHAPGLEGIAATRRARNGDILVDFYPDAEGKVLTVRVAVTVG